MLEERLRIGEEIVRYNPVIGLCDVHWLAEGRSLPNLEGVAQLDIAWVPALLQLQDQLPARPRVGHT